MKVEHSSITMAELPNYQLGELKTYNPNILLEGDPEEKGFVVALAAAYNDMKDYFWLHNFLYDNPPANPQEVNPYNGQYRGQLNFVFRKLVGVLFELTELLKRNQELLERPSVKEAEERIPVATKSSWERLKNFSLGSTGKSTVQNLAVSKAILRIRHNVSSHYYGVDNFLGGFRSYVERDTQTAGQVCLSVGDQMQKTRFYFADAAVQCRIGEILNKTEVIEEQIITFVREMNIALRFFIDSYLESEDRLRNSNRADRRALAKKRRKVGEKR